MPETPNEIPVARLNHAMEQLSSDITRIISDSGLDGATVNRVLHALQGAMLQARRNLNLP